MERQNCKSCFQVTRAFGEYFDHMPSGRIKLHTLYPTLFQTTYITIQSQWAQDFLYLSRLTLGPNQPLVHWVTCLFPGVKHTAPGADHPPYLSSRLKSKVANGWTCKAVVIDPTFNKFLNVCRAVPATDHQPTIWTAQAPAPCI
jgi:hypothetical protein